MKIVTIERIIYPNCPNCYSNNIIRRGKSYRGKGVIQRYYCKDCKIRFSNITENHRMRYPQWFIEKICELRDKGMSYAQIANYKWLSRQTARRWCIMFRRFKNRNKEVTINFPMFTRKLNGKISHTKAYSRRMEISPW